MATILNDAAYMGFPLSIKRGNPAPVDTTAVWYNKTELETYAASGATAYVGQILTLVADNKCEAYMISSEAGTLVKLAQTTATGDLATDVTNLQTQVSNLTKAIGAAAAEGTEASGLYKLIADVEATTNNKVSSVSAADASVTIGGAVTAPTVKVAISAAEGNSLSVGEDGLFVSVPEVVHPEYSLAAAETSKGMLKSYKLQKDGKDIAGSVLIDIPKDLVVSSGSVVELENGALPDGVTEAGTYIKLVLANSEKPLYINVGKLIEYVTGGSGENDAIQINVSSDTHKVTANVKNGSLTKQMLAADVVASLDKADTAVQTVVAGDTNGTIKVDGKDVSVTGLQNAAFATVESINETAQGYVNTAKAALEGNDATDTDESATIKGAKKYADKVAKAASDNAGTALTNKIAELKNTDEAVANQFVTAVKEANGVVTVERKALAADDIPELGVSKITGLQGLLDGKQDTLTFDSNYAAGVNNVATVSTVNTAKSDLIGDTSAEAATTDGNTIADVRRYVDAKTKVLASDAKLTELSDKVTANTNSIATINTSLADGGSVSNAIADAKKAGTDAAKAVSDLENGKVKANADAIDAINNAETGILKQAKNYADGKDTAIAAAKKAGDDATTAVSALETGKVKNNADAITAINNKIGTIPDGKTVAQAIEDAKTDATYDDTALVGRVTVIEGDYLKAADKTEVKNEIKTERDRLDAFLNAAEVGDAAVDTLKEIQTYISTHGAAADEMVKNIAANKAAIEAEATTARAAEKKNADAITKLNGAADVDGSVSNKVMGAIADLQLDATYVKKEVDKRLMSNSEGTKLEGIAEGAQVNVIESIKVNNVAQTVDGKAVNIAVPIADDTSIAITENKIGIKAVDVQKLFVAEGDVLIIDGGNANSF